LSSSKPAFNVPIVRITLH